MAGGGTLSYLIQLGSVFDPLATDTIEIKEITQGAYITLLETGADSMLFRSVDGQLNVRFYQNPSFTPGVDQLHCVLLDANNQHAAVGSGGAGASCVELSPQSNVFAYTQTVQQIRVGVTYSHLLSEVINVETPRMGGNHPFSWRCLVTGEGEDLKTELFGRTFETREHDGWLSPKNSPDRNVIAYLLRDPSEEEPAMKLCYYDEEAEVFVRKTVTDVDTQLKLKVMVNEQEWHAVGLRTGEMEWKKPNGDLVEDIFYLPVQTLVDFIDGDASIEIDDDSVQVLHVTAIDKGKPKIRVQSSEVESDFFDLVKVLSGSGKEAELNEVSAGLFKSNQKIIIYESSPDIETLTESQWHALKQLGYLAVHNLTIDAVQIINDESLDSKAGEIMQDHHLFNQWEGPDVNPRYKKFWEKVFDPGTFDVHDFTVEISAKRHARFSNHCTEAWKRIIESVTDASGNLLPTVDKGLVRRTVIETAFEMVELYHLPIEKVRRYPPKAPGRAKPELGSKFDDLVKLDEGTDPIRWGDPTDHRRVRWAKYTPRIVGKYGKGILRSMPYVGHAITAWAVINFASNPREAIASELKISEEAAQLVLEGRAPVKLQFWQPNSPVASAQLLQGKVYIGMTYFYAHQHKEFGVWYISRVEEGNIVRIETTSSPGVVNLRVRVGQEERLHTNQSRILPGIPETGKPAPPGW